MNQNLQPLFDGPLLIPDFFFDPKTDIIYFRKTIDSKDIKFSTKVKRPNVAKARRVANRELRGKLNRKKARVNSLIKDELELWLKVKESEGHKYDTMNNIRRAKKQIEEFWGEKFPHEINRDNLTEWYQWWTANHSDIMMENAVKYLRNFCRYLAEKIVGGYPLLPAVPTIKDPAQRENRAQRQKKKEKLISPSDFKKIYETGQGDEPLITLFMYTMATRITETLSLRFGEEILLDQEIPTYRWSVGQNKAGLWGEHALHPSLIPWLVDLRKRRTSEGTNCLFPQKGDNKKPLREQMIEWDDWRFWANLSFHWTPHTFRHTCLSNLFSDPNNPQALICKLYRVSIQTAMEHYIKATQEGILKMRSAIKVNLS